MTHKDFTELSPALQHEYTVNACTHLMTIPAGEDIQVDLYHSWKGNFFVEFFLNKKRNELIFIKSYRHDYPLYKFLQNIEVSEAYRVLNSR